MDISTEMYFSDDSEEENIIRSRVRRNIRTRSKPLQLPTTRFISYFGLSKEAFAYLLNEMEGYFKQSTRTSAISPEIKLCAALRFFAVGSYPECGDGDFNIGLAQSTFSIVLDEVINIFDQHICAQWIKASMTVHEMQQSKLSVYKRSGFPGVVGFVDGMHVRICAPKKELQHLYLNWKGYYSLNVMIFSDYNQNIRFVDARFPGSNHDSHIWNMSTLKQYLVQSIPPNSWILGDAGYPLEKFIMTPFLNTMEDSPERTYNEIHSKARDSIATTIAVLKSKFRCLDSVRALHYTPDKVAKIVKACCILHNISLHFKVPFDDILTIDQEDSMPVENLLKNVEAEEIRNNIMAALQ